MIKKEELVSLFEDGWWYEEIALKYKMTSRNVRRTASIYGLKFERRNAKQVKIKNEYVCDGCGNTYLAFEKRDFCMNNCKMKSNFILNIENTKLDTNSILGNSILELKRTGLSHKQISLKLNCSKSTVSYYCNRNVSVRIGMKVRKNKLLEDSTYRFQKMLHNFKTRGANNYDKSSKDWNKKIRMSVIFFKNRNCMSIRERNSKYKYTYHEAIEHLGGMKTNCYLTGTPIDITKDQYCLDHKIPVSKGGDNNLENMGITIPLANYSKSSMDLNEYLDLCKLVLEYNGYEVNKI